MEAVANIRLASVFQPHSFEVQLKRMGGSADESLSRWISRTPVSIDQIFTTQWSASAEHQAQYIALMTKVRPANSNQILKT